MSGSGAHASCGNHASHSDAHGNAVAHHGGHLTVTKANAFETCFLSDGIRIYRYGADGTPRGTDGAKGTVEVRALDGWKHKVVFEPRRPADGEAALWYCTMDPDIVRTESGNCPRCGMQLVLQDYLFAPMDPAGLSGAGEREEEGTADIRLKDLGDPEKKVKFSQPWPLEIDAISFRQSFGDGDEAPATSPRHVH